MTVVWLTNIELPIVSEYKGLQASVVGGWLDLMSRQLVNEGHKLIALSPGAFNDCGEKGSLHYKHFRKRIGHKELTKVFEQLILIEKPDVIHIWGSEFFHAYDMYEACVRTHYENRCLLSVQGLVSFISRHYTAFLPERIVNRYTFRDFLKQDSIKKQRDDFERRGKYEIKLLTELTHIIGRTDWDYACVRQYNEKALYYHCNETLREVFYGVEWNLRDCEKHTLFMSQGYYPLKGLHLALEAIAILKKKYPHIKLYITGRDIMALSPFRISSYEKYIRDLLRVYEIENNIVFCGQLDEKQMVKMYLKSHVFINPSVIENSSNSIAEAMLVGCPCVASNVGGVNSMIDTMIEGVLYPADEPYMLAYYIDMIFSSDELAMSLSRNARHRARKEHNPQVNYCRLKTIYSEIANGSCSFYST